MVELKDEELQSVSGGSVDFSAEFSGAAKSEYTQIEKGRFYTDGALSECVRVSSIYDLGDTLSIYGSYAIYTVSGGMISISGIHDLFSTTGSNFMAKYPYVLN